MKKKPAIVLGDLGDGEAALPGVHVEIAFALDPDYERRDAERVAANARFIAEKTRRPDGPEDVRPGMLVVPASPAWYRGPGVVDRVDQLGCVWATYGPRPNTPPELTGPCRCFTPWGETRIVVEPPP